MSRFVCALPPTWLSNRIPPLSLCIHKPVHEVLNPAHHIFIYKAINQFIDYPSIGNITTDYDQGFHNCISEHTTLPPHSGHPSCLRLLKLQRNGTYGRIHFRHGNPQLPAVPAAHAEKSATLIFTTKEQNSGSAFISDPSVCLQSASTSLSPTPLQFMSFAFSAGYEAIMMTFLLLCLFGSLKAEIRGTSLGERRITL